MDPKIKKQLNNITIITAGVPAIIWELRDFFKLAWRVIRIVVLVMGVLVILGNILGIIDLPRF